MVTNSPGKNPTPSPFDKEGRCLWLWDGRVSRVNGLVLLGIGLVVLMAMDRAFAQPQTTMLKVQDAITLARTNNPAINQLRQRIRSRDGQRLSSYGIRSPQIMYTKEGIGSGTNNFTEQRWMLSQSLDFPVTTYFRLHRMSTETAVLEQMLETKYRALKVSVKMSYTELAYQLEIVHLRREQRLLAETLRQAVRTRVEVGESSELEQMRADILAAEAENEVAAAEQAFQQARYTLFNTIGIEQEEQPYEIQFPDTLMYSDVIIERAEVLAQLTGQPEMLGVSKELESRRLGIREAWTRFLPTITVNYYRQNFGTGFNFNGIDLGFTIPLWFPLEHRGRIQMAKASQSETVWRQKEVALNLKYQIETAWHNYDVSRQKIQRYHERIQRPTQSLLALTLEGYEAGELDLLALLDAQQTYLSSQRHYYDSLRDYYLRIIELERFLDRDLVFVP